MRPARPVEPVGSGCRDDAALWLPWWVNGTLAPDAAERVRAHVAGCASCRDDAAHLRQVRALLRAPAAVEHAPQPGLRRLMARLDAMSPDATGAHGPGPTPASTPAPAPAGAPAGGPRRAGVAATRGTLVRWLAAAVAVQAAALAAIVVAVGGPPASGDERAAPFRTLATASGAPNAATDVPRLRVLFAPTTTLAELQELLRAHQLAAVAGPSEAGLFTLALREPPAGTEARAAMLARLRADPRVRFAELTGP